MNKLQINELQKEFAKLIEEATKVLKEMTATVDKIIQGLNNLTLWDEDKDTRERKFKKLASTYLNHDCLGVKCPVCLDYWGEVEQQTNQSKIYRD